MADQGEGGIDASDDYDARIIELNKKNKKIAEETAQMEQRVLQLRKAKAARALSEAESAANRFTTSGNPFTTGSTTTVGEYIATNQPSFNEVGRPIPRPPSGNGENKKDKFSGAIDAEWSTFSSGKSQNPGDPSSLEKLGEAAGGSAALISVGAATVAAAFAAIVSASKGLTESQTKGAVNVNNTESTLGDAFQNLGINGEDKIALSNGGQRFKGKGDQKSYAEFYKRISDTKSSSKYFGPIDEKGIESLYSKFDEGGLTKDQLMNSAADPMALLAPSVAEGYATGFRKGNPTQSAWKNQTFNAALDRNSYASDLRNRDSGNEMRRVNNYVDAQANDSLWGTYNKEVLNKTGANRLLMKSEDEKELARHRATLERNTSPRPPSTKPE